MDPDVIAPLALFGVYALALGATAAVCYRLRHEILS